MTNTITLEKKGAFESPIPLQIVHEGGVTSLRAYFQRNAANDAPIATETLDRKSLAQKYQDILDNIGAYRLDTHHTICTPQLILEECGSPVLSADFKGGKANQNGAESKENFLKAVSAWINKKVKEREEAVNVPKGFSGELTGTATLIDGIIHARLTL